MTKEERKKALDAAIAQIEKNYGKGSIMKLNESHVTAVEVIPTGCLSVDLALGIGGLPRGRIVEIYGPESSGKTTLSLHVIAQAQKMGGTVAFIDAEHALDPVYARNLGIDTDNLLVSQPDNGEQGLDIAEALVRSGGVDVVVVDSVAALTPKAEIDGEMGDSQIGLQARLMSKALRILTSVCNKSKTCIIFINQLREKVGVMFGNPETTPGGKALKFYSSVRLDVRRVEGVKEGGEVVGNHTKVKVVKNKLAPPFKTAEFDIIFGKGISRESCLIDLGLDYKLFTKSGSWFGYKGERICQGRAALMNKLESDAQLSAEVEAAIRKLAEEKDDSKDESKDSAKAADDTAEKAEE
ncbi:recombinase RecA [Pumilibacter intestinalis]|uniref:recombinase RecA n=1 Tax=Pumilibacter intestinalis TaxID=2941511 RepID=UPI00203F7BA8|nr:recombinase RecA [Pumilibacter intestinalis]MCI8487614.1 recombinase RecA [Clostridia bacterium]